MNRPPVQPEPTLMLAGKPQIHCTARTSELQDRLCGLGLLQNHACVSGCTAGEGVGGAANNGNAGMEMGGRLFNVSVYCFLNLKTLSSKMFISRD